MITTSQASDVHPKSITIAPSRDTYFWMLNARRSLFLSIRSIHFTLNIKLTPLPPLPRVCIRDAKEAFSVYPRFPDKFQYMVLDVEDNEEQNLIRLFPGCVRYMRSLPASSDSFVGPPHTHRYHIVYALTIDQRPRAQSFIQQAIAAGGRVLVHCNGTTLTVRSR